jgi:hypothetical protein
MRTARLRRRRSRAQLALLAAVAALAFLVSGVAAGLVGYLTAATNVGVRSAMAESAGVTPAYEITTRASADAEAADAAVTEAVARVLPGVPYALHRSLVSGARSVFRGADGRAADRATDDDLDDDRDDDQDDDATAAGETDADAIARGVLAAYDDLAGFAELVAGQWPDQAGATEHIPVALHDGSAVALGLTVGDVVSISDRGEIIALTITGTWRPNDVDDPFWYGVQVETDGADSRTGLIAVVSPSALAAIPGTSVTSRWRLVPEVDRLTAADVATLRAGLARLPLLLELDARISDGRVGVDEALLGVLRSSDDRIQAARAVAVVPLIVLAVVSVLALGLVARLLAMVREQETVLLRARGAATSLLSRWTLREALVAAGMPAAAGGLAAYLALRRLPEIGPEVSLAALVVSTAGAGVLAVVTLVLVGSRAARRRVASAVESRAASTRRSDLVRSGTGILVAAAAGIGLWQLDRLGAPTVVDRTGRSVIDPIAVAAPTAALLAAAFGATLAVVGAARLAQRLSGRRRGLAGSLAVRHVARRPAAYSLPVLIVVMATGGGTLAAGFAATWTDLQGDVAAQRTGADLQVVLRPGPVSAGGSAGVINLDRYRAVEGVRSATPVVAAPRATIADGAVELLVRPGDPDGLPAGVELPAGARSIEVAVAAAVQAHLEEFELELRELEPEDVGDPPPRDLKMAVWLADGDGVTSLVTLDLEIAVSDEREPYTVRADLPDGAQPWRILAVDFELRGSSDQVPFWHWGYDVEVTGLHAVPGNGRADLGSVGGWARLASDVRERFHPQFTVSTPPDGLGIVVNPDGHPWFGTVSERLVAGPGGQANRPEPVPVVATAAALDRFGLAVGDHATLHVFNAAVPVVVTDSLPVAMGTTSAEVMVAETAVLTQAVLAAGRRPPQVNQVWLEVAPEALADGSAAAAVAELAGRGSAVLDRNAIEEELRGNVFAGLSVITFWVASIAAAVLAVAGLAAGSAAVARQRASEVTVLRALGMSPAQQARSRRREQAFIVMLAVAAGALAGWLVTYLSANLLALAATPNPLETLEPMLRFAAAPWAGFVGAALAAGLLVALAQSARVRRAAATFRREV